MPSGAESDAENPVELVGADSLLAGAHHDDSLHPKMHRHMAILEDGADLDGEGLPTGIALIDADPSALGYVKGNIVEVSGGRNRAAGLALRESA
jgi:hypothetical protein